MSATWIVPSLDVFEQGPLRVVERAEAVSVQPFVLTFVPSSATWPSFTRPSFVESLVARGHELLCWSIRFGTVLHQKDRYWSDLQQTCARHLPLPSATVAEERAERARRLLEGIGMIGDDDAVQEQSITMLTHLARARLIRADVFPASRPELPKQLRSIGESALASQLTDALQKRHDLMETHESFSPQP